MSRGTSAIQTVQSFAAAARYSRTCSGSKIEGPHVETGARVLHQVNVVAYGGFRRQDAPHRG
jgi:hypothetical protein